MSDENWSSSELGGAVFGDKRLTRRLVAVAKEMGKSPGRTLGSAMNRTGAKAAYRLFNSAKVSPEAVLAPHRTQTIARIKADQVVLVAQDTTVLNFTTHEGSEGFGGIGGGYSVNHGCFLHSALAFNEDGVPQGILSLTQMSRATKSTKKESKRWSETVREIAALKDISGPRLIHLADQEGDDWSLLSACAETNSSFVIRADGRRLVSPGVSMRDRLALAPSLGMQDVPVSAKKLRKGHGLGTWKAGNDRPASAARTASVEVRVATITVPRSSNRPDGLPNITMTVISACEIDAPAHIKDPLTWYLMTDEPVTTLKEAEQVIGWYRQRWAIETWHRTLKSGIKVEECRLANYKRMKRFIVLAAILAWRIDWMVKVAREQPDTPAEALLDSLELETLTHANPKQKNGCLTVRDAVRQIAALGGFAGRKSDGEPGSKTFWLGWLSLMSRAVFLDSYKKTQKKKDVGTR